MSKESIHDVRRRVRRIIHVGERLPPDIRRDVIEADADVVPALIEILENRELSLEKAPGDGWAPAHAAHLLGELRAAAAVEPMLRVLAETDALDALHSAIVCSLPDIGEPAVEPALLAFNASERGDLRASLAAVLARTGVRDARILGVLLAQLEVEPEGAAGDLAEYGDEAALPALRSAFDRYELVDSESPLANHTLVELRAAIEDLGGILSPSQREKYERGMEAGDRWRRAMHAALEARTSRARQVRPGRNEPCWCGGGKKYKRCHLTSDDAGSTSPAMTAGR
jgi:hypothetical protein